MYGAATIVVIKHLTYKMPYPKSVVTVIGISSDITFQLDLA